MHTRAHFHAARLGQARTQYGGDYPQVTTTATDAASGGAVTWIVGALKKTAWYSTASAKDKAAVEAAGGTFTPELTEAVKSFQRSVGLDPDGIVGPLTYGKLGYTGAVSAPEPKKQEISGGGAARFGKGKWWTASWVFPALLLGGGVVATGVLVYLDDKKRGH